MSLEPCKTCGHDDGYHRLVVEGGEWSWGECLKPGCDCKEFVPCPPPDQSAPPSSKEPLEP